MKRQPIVAEIEQPEVPEFCRYCFRETVKDRACGQSKNELLCTRKFGHTGPHVACSLGEHNMIKWGGMEKRIVCGKRTITIIKR